MTLRAILLCGTAIPPHLVPLQMTIDPTWYEEPTND